MDGMDRFFSKLATNERVHISNTRFDVRWCVYNRSRELDELNSPQEKTLTLNGNEAAIRAVWAESVLLKAYEYEFYFWLYTTLDRLVRVYECTICVSYMFIAPPALLSCRLLTTSLFLSCVPLLYDVYVMRYSA